VLTLTLIDAVCLGAGMWVLGLPGPFFLAGIAAVLAWLPYLGSVTGCLLVVLGRRAPCARFLQPAL